MSNSLIQEVRDSISALSYERARMTAAGYSLIASTLDSVLCVLEGPLAKACREYPFSKAPTFDGEVVDLQKGP
jgi:hypothetical protein